MGISGNDVTKATADMVLMDDNFASIITGIEEGRTLFDNLKKTIAYVITHLVPEALPTLITLSAGFPLGLNPMQILTIDLFTESMPSISLSYEPSEGDVMDRPPRNNK